MNTQQKLRSYSRVQQARLKGVSNRTDDPAPDLEPAISLAKAARLPQVMIDGQSLSPVTLWRWGKLGVRRDSDGCRIYLEVSKRGKKCFTTEAAINRFMAALNGRDVPATEIVTTSAQAAERELASAGIA